MLCQIISLMKYPAYILFHWTFSLIITVSNVKGSCIMIEVISKLPFTKGCSKVVTSSVLKGKLVMFISLCTVIYFSPASSCRRICRWWHRRWIYGWWQWHWLIWGIPQISGCWMEWQSSPTCVPTTIRFTSETQIFFTWLLLTASVTGRMM